jgi:adenylate kinase
MPKVVFVGGVHGVGKSSMCAHAAERVGATHLTASTLISEAKQDAIAAAGKRAADVPGNQELLLKRFAERTSTVSGVVLLDGHYTILNAHGEAVRLGADLFAALGVSTFLCIRGDAEAIRARLADRDGHGPSADDVSLHQQIELAQAAEVARQQGAELQVIEAFDTVSLVAVLGG